MELIKQSVEIVEPTGFTISDIYKSIELAGRVSHKSEDRITEGSAEKFVNMLLRLNHLSTLEFGTVYLKIPKGTTVPDTFFVDDIIGKYLFNSYSRVEYDENNWLITSNYRVLYENDWLDDLKYLCEPTEKHQKRIISKFTSSIHTYKDITRHRVFSFMIESTRYCNYLNERFSSSVAFIYPTWLKEEEKEEFCNDLKTIESIYFKWIDKGWQAQQAAAFLPQITKGDVYMCGYVSDYKHFFSLRASKHAHPLVQEVAYLLKEEFAKKGLIPKINIHN